MFGSVLFEIEKKTQKIVSRNSPQTLSKAVNWNTIKKKSLGF